MKVDESGAPWPYEELSLLETAEGVPTWECPGGICACHAPSGEETREPHTLVFYDGGAVRMPHARCRVRENGVLINVDAPHADPLGELRIEVRPTAQLLELDWAPEDTPERDPYPYRRLYHLDLGHTQEQGVERRLVNLGFYARHSLEENIKDYQRAYHQTPTGHCDDVASQIALFHDHGLLPPIGGGGAPDPASPGQEDARSQERSRLQQVDAQQADPAPGTLPTPAADEPPSAFPPGGRQAKGSAAKPTALEIRVRVRTRSGVVLVGSEVTVDAGQPKTAPTKQDGFASFLLREEDFGLGGAPTTVQVRVVRRHHGPDPGPKRGAAVKTGAFTATLRVTPTELAQQSQQTLLLPGPSSPGVVEDAPRSRFLDVVLMDAGMATGADHRGVPTRRLTSEQVQQELILHRGEDRFAPTKDSELVFEHDPSNGPLDPCTPKCKLFSADKRLNLEKPVISDVTFFHLLTFGPSEERAGDVEGQRFTRDVLTFRNSRITLMDQRHLVGMVRFCRALSLSHQIVAIYTVEVGGDTSTKNTHGYGLCIDFSGCGKALPAVLPKTALGSATTPMRMGVDFIVFYHWGRVPMWDPTTVAAAPGTPSAWKRMTLVQSNADKTNYKDVSPSVKRLHYRLDPAPFQTPQTAPSGSPATLQPELNAMPLHFSTAKDLFFAAYRFFVAEYNDDNESLGPGVVDVPTAIDAGDGHFILHPDYGEPNSPPKEPGKESKDGRQAHQNHIHAQLGKTNYPKARK